MVLEILVLHYDGVTSKLRVINAKTWWFSIFNDVHAGVALVALGKFPEMSEAADWVLGDMPNDIDELVAIEEVSM